MIVTAVAFDIVLGGCTNVMYTALQSTSGATPGAALAPAGVTGHVCALAGFGIATDKLAAMRKQNVDADVRMRGTRMPGTRGKRMPSAKAQKVPTGRLVLAAA